MHHWDYTQFAGQVFNLLVLIGLLWYFLRIPVKKFLESRQAGVAQALEEATRLYAEAERQFKQYQGKIAHMDDELARLHKEVILAGERERERLIADGREKATRMKREAEQFVQQQLAQARHDLTLYAAHAVEKAARTFAVSDLGTKDQDRISEQFVQSLRDAGKVGQA